MSFKHQVVNQKEELDVKPWESYHNISLQNSKFITLDHDARHLEKVYNHELKT
jgi:hypothetical protein